MTVKIDFPPQLEAQLQEEAARRGQDPSEYVRAVVEDRLRLTALEALRHRIPPQSLTDLKPRVPPLPGESWLAAVVGQWPGEESDEEFERMLDELN